MDQQQVQANNLSQCIISIDTIFDTLTLRIKDELCEIEQKSNVLLFLGKFGGQLDKTYTHFQSKEVKQETKYYKLIKLQEGKKIMYLLNFPFILSYKDNNEALDLCISKILAEKALQRMKKCNFTIILDYQELIGEDDRTKLDQILNQSIFCFGSCYFSEDYFFLLKQINQESWEQYQFEKGNKFFQFFVSQQPLKTQIVQPNQIINSILSNDSNLSVQTQQENYVNYGLMEHYLKNQFENLLTEVNVDLASFQKLLLNIQQIPNLKSNPEAVKEIEMYLKQLYEDLSNSGYQITTAFEIFQVYTIINQVNQKDNAQKINERQSKCFQTPQLNQFFQDQKIKELKIYPLLDNNTIIKLNKIINIFKMYFSTMKNDKIKEVEHLILNLKQWCQYCDQALENILYDLKYITSRIQDGPKQDIENGIYFIGITRVGKSTIINSLLTPQNVVQTQFLSKSCYKVEYDSKFQIANGGVSETQKLTGLYVGTREELKKIFNDEVDKSVFSVQEMSANKLIQECLIPDKTFVFDCPGFDDNANELMRIAHRISLYNYFSRTKNIVVFFVVDISQQQIESIKNTFDPITYLLEDRKDLEIHFEKWTSLILTKAKIGQRQQYLDNWNQAFKGQFEDNYSFFKKLFANQNSSIEFFKPSKNHDQNCQYIKQMSEQIINRIKQQLQQNQKCMPQFKLLLDDKVWALYQECIPKIKLKLEFIIQFFLKDLDDYILECEDSISDKHKFVQNIKTRLLDNNLNNKKNQITQENCENFIKNLKYLVEQNQYLNQNDFFITQYMEDFSAVLKISKYCKNNKSLAPFEINIDNLIKKVQIIQTKIQEITTFYQRLKFTGYAASFITAIVSCGSSLALLETQALLILTRQVLLSRGALWFTTIGSGSASLSSGISLTFTNFIETMKNKSLKKEYNLELRKWKDQDNF